MYLDSILQRTSQVLLITGLCIWLSACNSTGENQVFTYEYKLSPTDSFSKGEAECETEAEALAIEAMEVESIEILKASSAMKIDRESGKSSVECTIIVAPPNFD